MNGRRALATVAVAVTATLAVPGVALAQEQQPTEVNCYPLLSSLICEVPVNVGPFNFDVDVPIESVFPPPPA